MEPKKSDSPPPSHPSMNIQHRNVAGRPDEESYVAATQAAAHSRLTAFAPLALVQPAYEAVLAQAHHALAGHHPEMAVVLAYAAAELCTEATMIELLGAHVAGKLVEPLRGVFPTYDICSEKLLDFYIALSGDSIQKALFRTKLKDSRKRRNLIVHKGKKCSPKDAGDCSR